ncbi:MAG: hypothetical protein CME62_05835 [Halobacteriovoraceae bacterium]|nr:hypothetical protein [Halobacteriovoraceae bacterium]|tara:strand:+ start:29517 stop:31601 length:2085 start_codon:yes stop_codon:yes gene_type:complete
MIKTILFTFILIQTSWAQTNPTPSAAAEVDPREVNLFLEAVTEKNVERQLLESPQFERCKNSLGESTGELTSDERTALRTCVAEEFAKLDDSAIEQISDRLNLGSFDKTAAKSTKSIREYLNERLSNAIYGEETDANGKLKALKDRKAVNHDIYYQLYQEQIGKNTLLSISQYCLENFGYENKLNIVDPNLNKYYPVINSDGSEIPGITYGDLTNGIHPQDSPSDKKVKGTLRVNADGSSVFIWSNAKEYTVCSGQADCSSNSSKKRSVEQIDGLKKMELKLGAQSPDQIFIKKRYVFCATQVIKNMCEKYKCKNAYNSSNLPQGDPNTIGTLRYCSVTLGVTPENRTDANLTAEGQVAALSDLSNNNMEGQLACNLQERLREFRAAYNLTKETQEDFRESAVVSANFNSGQQVFDGSGRNGNKSVDELTSIASSEFGDVEELKNSEDTAQELRDNCFEDNGSGGRVLKDGAEDDKKCAPIIASLNKESFQELQNDAEAETAVLIGQVDKLSDNKEEIQEFVTKNGLETVITAEEIETLDASQIQERIKSYYRTRKLSELDAIRQRFDAEVRLETVASETPTPGASTKDEVAEKAVENIETHKQRVQNLYQYSNVVSSYLSLKDADNNVIEGSNTTGRNMEMDNPLDDETESILEQYTGGSEQASTSNGSGGFQYVDFLDQVLGLKETENDGAN